MTSIVCRVLGDALAAKTASAAQAEEQAQRLIAWREGLKAAVGRLGAAWGGVEDRCLQVGCAAHLYHAAACCISLFIIRVRLLTDEYGQCMDRD